MAFACPQFSTRLLEALRQSRHIAVFTGAGISAESGITTFRTAQTGLWHHLDPQQICSIAGLRNQPDVVWGLMALRRAEMLQAQPNAAHIAIAKLATKVNSLSLITQNDDDLHERAGSSSVIHLHGEMMRPRCFGCGRDYSGPFHAPDIVADGSPIEPPRCQHCNGRIRPGPVLFGENLTKRVWEAAAQAMRGCDLCLIVGTSGKVNPAASLPLLAKRNGAVLVQVNLEPNDFSPIVDFELPGAAGVVLPALIEAAFGV